MSISSAMNELVAVNPALTRRQLLRSGMNIGRDMVGTMTNTLILALVGSSLVLMILSLFRFEPSFSQLMSGTFFSVEMVQAIASSVGVILAVPLSALIGAFLFAKHKKVKRRGAASGNLKPESGKFYKAAVGERTAGPGCALPVRTGRR